MPPTQSLYLWRKVTLGGLLEGNSVRPGDGDGKNPADLTGCRSPLVIGDPKLGLTPTVERSPAVASHQPRGDAWARVHLQDQKR